MSHDGRRFRGDEVAEESTRDGGSRRGAPGKRSLTQHLAPPEAGDDWPLLPVIQMAAIDGGARGPATDLAHDLDAAVRPDLHAAPSAPGGGRALDAGVRAGMERSFGADFSSVRVHEGEHVADAGALAYTQGTDLHFAPGHYAPDGERGRELIGHELAHVVQQAQGRVSATAQAKGAGGALAINDDASLEREADELGGRAARGERVAAPGAPTIAGADASRAVVQRYAWVGGTQVKKSAPNLTPAMEAMVKDTKVRDYTDDGEFKKHAGGTTDYLGNLNDGTWVRFSPTGINLVGENHTIVKLEEVMPAVGSTSFIYEPFASDDLSSSPKMKSAYETENADRFKDMGVDKEPDKQQFGAESLYPKIGFGLTLALPYFDGTEPVSGLKKAGYVGQPIQRYLKIAWGYSADNKASVAARKQKKQSIPKRQKALAKVHAAVEGKLDAWITALPVDGFLGDELEKKGADKLLPSLHKFAKAVTDAMMEMATTDPNSGLSTKDRKKFKKKKATSQQKEDTFSEWRDNEFEETVAAATKRGVRYAGMGQLHLENLVKNGLTAGQHPYYMADKDLTKFKKATTKLAASAVAP
jgi:hypothetical protein